MLSPDPGRKPLVSAIVVTWNRPELLRECLRALVAAGEEAGIPLEIIVVDNASTAGDAEVVAQGFPDVKLLRAEENLGFARAVNRALKWTHAPTILLVNNDVEVTGAALREARELLAHEPTVGIVGVRLTDPKGGPQLSHWVFDTPMRLLAEALGLPAVLKPRRNDRFAGAARERVDDWLPVDYVSGAFFLIRQEVLEQVGTLDERFYFYTEEADLCLRAREAGWRTAYLPNARVVHHHGATTSGHAARSRLWLLESRVRFVCKHHGSLWSPPVRLAALLGAGPLMLKGLAMIALGRIQGQPTALGGGKVRFERGWRAIRWAICPRRECPEFFR